MRGNGATQITLDDKPFWVAGKVDGQNLSTISTNGRYGFTVARASGYAVGVYYISFGSNP